MGGADQLSGVLPRRIKLFEDSAKHCLAYFPVYGLVENYGEVAADPIVDLFDSIIVLVLPEDAVDVGDDGGDRRGYFGSSREPSSDRVGADAFNKAGRAFPWLGSVRKRSGGGFQVRVGDRS